MPRKRYIIRSEIDDDIEEWPITDIGSLSSGLDGPPDSVVPSGVLDSFGEMIYYEIIPEPCGIMVHDEDGNAVPRHTILP